MMEQRRYKRITFSVPGNLIHHDLTYQGRVENISLRGALISADEFIMIPPGDVCTLSLWPRQADSPIVITARVVHSFFSMVGVHFVDFAGDDEVRLFELMKAITNDPDQLRKEWEGILAQRGEQADD